MESMVALDSDVYRQKVWEQVKEIMALVEQAVEASSAVHELERGLWERMLALGHGCLKLFFSLCGDGDEGETLVLPEGRVLQRLPERHGRPYQSVLGPFELARVAYGTREGQKIEAVPLDERLRLPASQVLLPVTRMDAAEHRAVARSAKLGHCWRPSCRICPWCTVWSACITNGAAMWRRFGTLHLRRPQHLQGRL